MKTIIIMSIITVIIYKFFNFFYVLLQPKKHPKTVQKVEQDDWFRINYNTYEDGVIETKQRLISQSSDGFEFEVKTIKPPIVQKNSDNI